MLRSRLVSRRPTPLQWLLVAPVLLILLASALIWAAVFAALALMAAVLFGVLLILRPDLRRLIFGFWRAGRHMRRSSRSDYESPNGTISL